METHKKSRNVCVSEHKTEPKPKNQKIIQYGWWNVRKLVCMSAFARFQAIDTLVRPLSRTVLYQHSLDKALVCNYENALIKVIEAVKRQVLWVWGWVQVKHFLIYEIVNAKKLLRDIARPFCCEQIRSRKANHIYITSMFIVICSHSLMMYTWLRFFS